MNKKILIGSIIAITVLIGVSFTSVVGYKSVESDVKASPLFNIRSSRAVETDNMELSYDYIGKGEKSNILLSKANKGTESLDFLIKASQRMDDTSLQRLAHLIIYQIHQNDIVQELNYEEIYLSLKQLGDTPEIENEGNQLLPPLTGDPFFCTMDGIWGPGCVIIDLITLISAILILLRVILYTCGFCGPYPNTCTFTNKLNLL